MENIVLMFFCAIFKVKVCRSHKGHVYVTTLVVHKSHNT